MKDQSASRDEPAFSEELVSLALGIDNWLREREREKNYSSRLPPLWPSPAAASVVPLQIHTPEVVTRAATSDLEP